MTTKVKMELNFNPEDIIDFDNYIKEESPSGILTKLEELPPAKGSMGMSTYLPIIEILLGSSVVAAGIKGLFEIIKKWFDLKKEEVNSKFELEKLKLEEKKVTFTKVVDDNKTETLTLSLFNENERKQFLSFIKK